MTGNMTNTAIIGAVLGGSALVLVMAVTIAFSIVMVCLCRRINKLERLLRNRSRKARLSRSEEGSIRSQQQQQQQQQQNQRPSSHIAVDIPISGTSVGYNNEVSTSTNRYASTPQVSASNPSSPVVPVPHVLAAKAWSDSYQYTDISGGPLPGFLRNEDMLLAPVVSEDVIIAAQAQDEEQVKEAESFPPPPPYQPPAEEVKVVMLSDDYVDPQDVKNQAEALKQHEKITKKLSMPSQASTDKKLSLPVVANTDGDYTMVSDALPSGAFEKIDMGRKRNSVGDKRIRTSSDASPMLSRKSNDSGKSSASSPSIKKKTQSLNRPSKPKHLVDNNQNASSSQPTKRRSTVQKEMVCFDPNTAGFKLSTKRTNSDGATTSTNTQTPPISRESHSTQNSPVTNHNKTFDLVMSAPDEGFIENAHVYAAVNLGIKYLPEGNILRREGVGPPDHFLASVACK